MFDIIIIKMDVIDISEIWNMIFYRFIKDDLIIFFFIIVIFLIFVIFKLFVIDRNSKI